MATITAFNRKYQSIAPLSMRLFVCFCCAFIAQIGYSQNDSSTISDSTNSYTIAPDDEILSMIDSTLASMYFKSLGFVSDTAILNIYSYSADSIPVFTDSVYKARMEMLDAKTPLDLTYNKYVHAFIDLYANRRRELTSNMLGIAPVYFPMFEEALDKFDMPLELKYLAIVESALNPKAVSRSGAKGLWQFMYATGKMYGLNVTSYFDERMDPYKSTIAACNYMQDLYKMYGDWNMVLAAYNSGPGNVNKAIRRSGGKRDFWEIRPFLPRETRSYVPAFIAVNYLMNYSSEHNIFPTLPEIHCFKRDTVHVSLDMTFEQISNYIDLPVEYIEYLNPTYKMNYIPAIDEAKTLCLPSNKIGVYLTNEKAMYADLQKQIKEDSILAAKKAALMERTIVHVVRSGDVMGVIADRYNCTVSQLMYWNNKKSTRIYPGERLKIITMEELAGNNKENESKKEPKISTEGEFEYYTIQSGDTLWDLAKKFNNISVNELKEMNSNLNFRRLKPGMKVKVKAI